MSPWLTFVVGVILGLLVGWLIDLLHQRTAAARREVEPGEAGITQPASAPPMPQPEAVSTTALPAGTEEISAESVVGDATVELEAPSIESSPPSPPSAGVLPDVGLEDSESLPRAAGE